MKRLGDDIEELPSVRAARRVPTVSAVLADGSSVEMVYDRADGSTELVVSRDGDWMLVPEVAQGDRPTLVPLSPTNNLLVHNVVLFAQHPAEYGTKAELVEA